MLDPFYHMRLKLLWNRVFGVYMLRFCQIYVILLWTSLHNVAKYVNHLWFIDFNTWCYINPTTSCDNW